MTSRVGALLLLVVLILCGVWLYHQHELTIARNGEVLSHDVAVTTSAGNDTSSSESTSNSSPPAPASAPAVQPGPPAGTAALFPNTDSVAPNPPNGLAFGGTGRYQWYRQGNLTWRVDTGSGAACVAFATMEEWHKTIVSSHGCGNS